MSNNNYSVPIPTDASIILTYRCPMKCKMCNIWFNPTNKSEEIKASDLIWNIKTLPRVSYHPAGSVFPTRITKYEIGRASCRERV